MIFALLPRAVIAALLLALLAPGRPAGGEGFRKVDGPCGLSFPADHGAHRQFRTEWWYYTGNLQAEQGRLFGFQLTFFRVGLRPPQEKPAGGPQSAWRSDHLFIAHAALTDVLEKRHFTAEAAAREALEMAGAGRPKDDVVVFVGNWHARIGAGRHRLSAAGENFSLALTLVPEKPPVLHGRSGYSRKGSAANQASCYYSLTRLRTAGTVQTESGTWPVNGCGWMDHEFSTAPLAPDLVGWDWFSLRLSDGTELMAYFLREKDGRFHASSSGTFVDARGGKRHLAREQLSLKSLNKWKSPDSGAVYPMTWRLSVSDPPLSLRIRPRLKNQEVDARKTTGTIYWEGAVAVEGTAAGRPVSGDGYVELTGYARAFDAPM